MPLGAAGLTAPGNLQASPAGIGRDGLSIGPLTPQPDFANVQALMGWDGADAAQAFTDESSNAAVATFVADAQLDTAQSVFGSASLLLADIAVNTDWVTFPDLPAYDLAANDWCIESYIRHSHVPTASQIQYIMTHWGVSGQRAWALSIATSSGGIVRLSFLYTVDGSSLVGVNRDIEPTPVVADTWYHAAVSRDGINLRHFWDGQQIGATEDLTGVTIAGSNNLLTIGHTITAIPNPFQGWLDETRLTIGEPIYTENFIPPGVMPRS